MANAKVVRLPVVEAANREVEIEMPSDAVPAFDENGESVIHQGPAIPGTDAPLPPTKHQRRAGKKIMRKAFAKKDQMGSSKADAKRRAHAFIERQTGQKLSWKAARKRLKHLSHVERGLA